MKVIDPGHVYELSHLDGCGVSRVTFVKREGAGYPGNVGHHEGTNLQDVLRALIHRVKYLDHQIPHHRNQEVLFHLRMSIFELELRAAERHGRELVPFDGHIEDALTCRWCGHIQCAGIHGTPHLVPAVESVVESEEG